MRRFWNTYSHCRHKIGLSFFEAETPRYNPSTGIRDESLSDEDKRDNGQISEFFRRQLRTKFDEDYRILASRSSTGDNKSYILRHGVNSMTLRLATNF
jgi:hypothetical protein